MAVPRSSSPYPEADNPELDVLFASVAAGMKDGMWGAPFGFGTGGGRRRNQQKELTTRT
jgi:hypothetical protein